ncbi:MAG: ABC transporter permease [Lachnospiraceae bacterium]
MMGRLIKAEFLKLSKSLGYKILLLCTFGYSVMIGLFAMDVETGRPDGVTAYLSVLSDAGMYMSLAAIFAAIFVCNEFSNRTFGMSLFSGCPRWRVLLSKVIVFLIGFMPVVFLEPLMSGIVVSINKGFGDLDTGIWIDLLQATFLFILGSVAIGGFSFMLAVIIKNIVGTIGAGLGLVLGMQMLGIIPQTTALAKLTLMYQVGLLPQPESTGMFIAVTAVTLAVTLAASTFIFEKADLK